MYERNKADIEKFSPTHDKRKKRKTIFQNVVDEQHDR